jgi:hypothetical protein
VDPRNNITLPDSLPTCLRPTFLKSKLEHSHKKHLKQEQMKETVQNDLVSAFNKTLKFYVCIDQRSG